MRFNDFFQFEFLLYGWQGRILSIRPGRDIRLLRPRRYRRNAMNSLLAVVSNTSNAHGLFVVKRFVLKYCVKHALGMKNFTTPSTAPLPPCPRKSGTPCAGRAKGRQASFRKWRDVKFVKSTSTLGISSVTNLSRAKPDAGLYVFV